MAPGEEPHAILTAGVCLPWTSNWDCVYMGNYSQLTAVRKKWSSLLLWKKMIKCCNSNGVNNVFQKAVLKLNRLCEPFISVLHRKKKLLWITEYCLFLGSLGLFTIFVLISTFSRFMGFLLVWILAFTEHVKGKQKKGRGKGSQKSLLLHDLNFF